MDSSGEKIFPAAPYPPMISSAFSSRGRSLSLSKHSSSSAGKISKQHMMNSPPPSRINVTKRRLPSRVEFFNSEIYGSVNCKEHLHPHQGEMIQMQNQSNSQSLEEGNVEGSTLNPNLTIYGNNNMPPSALRKKRVGTSASAMGKRLGPVLLDLRYFTSESANPTNSIDNNPKRATTFAISRGIAALGTGNVSTALSSTCLSFRKLYDGQGNLVQDDVLSNPNCAIQVATGLTTGALCIHSLRNIGHYFPRKNSKLHENIEKMSLEERTELMKVVNEVEEDEKYQTWEILDSAKSQDATVSYFSHYQPKNHRSASTVAWNSYASQNHLVAIGILGSSGMSGGTDGASSRDVGGRGNEFGKERDYGALVWDVGASQKGMRQTPLLRLAHNAGVSSVNWLHNGNLLAVGVQRNIQVYDIRTQGRSKPPITIQAHDNAVHGIRVDPLSDYFVSFSRAPQEPVKIWDLRKTGTHVAEIKFVSEIKLQTKRTTGSDAAVTEQNIVADVAWGPSSHGTLTIASNDSLRYYETRINLSRPMLTRITNAQSQVQSVAFQTRSKKIQRMLAVDIDGSVNDLPLHQVSPFSISPRDGRVVSSVESDVFSGSQSQGPCAMEKNTFDITEDISATMMRRARCLHVARYSTDASSNLEMISREIHTIRTERNLNGNLEYTSLISSCEQLWRLWSWIDRVEQLCARKEKDINIAIDERRLPAKGLHDAGLLSLLRMNKKDSEDVSTFDKSTISPLFNRNIFDSPMRRAALTACGWCDQYGVQEALSKLEARGKHEKAAALAVWNSNIGEAVAYLQRGADYIRSQECDDPTLRTKNSQYAETLELFAMCIAGYNGSIDSDSPTGAVWRKACEKLLERFHFEEYSTFKRRGSYLRAVCSFLIKTSKHMDVRDTLDDKDLSLSDRCAFACIFLSWQDLKEFLESSVAACIQEGHLEGILITGLNQEGIRLLQSYVDIYADVQTAALVSSRVIIPPHFVKETQVCNEWLEKYREMLNKFQMWQSRALFDVGRVELLRKLKQRSEEKEPVHTGTIRPLRAANIMSQRRRNMAGGRQNDTESPSQAFPPQIQARCNYCNTTLSLSRLMKRQDGIANNWLSKANPILSCCPNSQCRKPLPRCAICLLPLGCLNPYLELRKGKQNVDDLSELSNLPFAEWFTWCMKCKHGGHAHHMVGWFSNHSTCPVSNCDCNCEFDSIQKLKRPQMTDDRE